MIKRVLIALLGVAILAGVIAGIKFLQIRKMIDQGSKFVMPSETVTTFMAVEQEWENRITAVGTLAAVQGVTVSSETTGRVVRILFEPGSRVQAGDLLIKLDTSTEEAQLAGAEAALALARSNLDRTKELLARQLIPQSQSDAAVSTFDQAEAQTRNLRTLIAKKSVRAPFDGRLGTRLVNLGQHLKEGDPIVSLQSLDPIFSNFSLPQQQVGFVRPGLVVEMSTDALPGRSFQGTVTTIHPEVDPATRSVRVQATLRNPGEALRPGMFVSVAVNLPEKKKALVIPATAVLYAPYSDSVFVIEEKKDEKADPSSGKAIRQQFVKLGEKRGDFVGVLTGLKAGETVVSTGVFKLRSGQPVVIDNTLAPDFKLNPRPEEN